MGELLVAVPEALPRRLETLEVLVTREIRRDVLVERGTLGCYLVLLGLERARREDEVVPVRLRRNIADVRATCRPLTLRDLREVD